jgi:hypothetical protein
VDLFVRNSAELSDQNGQTIIDYKEIPGITGSALDSREELPGPIYLQGSEKRACCVSQHHDYACGALARNAGLGTPQRAIGPILWLKASSPANRRKNQWAAKYQI